MESNFKPGDVISCDDGNHLSYVFATDNGGVGVNACSQSWIKDGRRYYGQELYPLTEDDSELFEYVGHYGNGFDTDGMEWYEKNKERAV